MSTLKAPFPWFGGKSRVAAEVWNRFGSVKNYVEPFFGSGAVLLARSDWDETKIETVNDKDGLVANFWRAVKFDPEEVAYWADNPVNEADLHARHVWLVNQLGDFLPKVEGDPDYYDAKIAGWWVWGVSCWIGSGWCSGKGPWMSVDGRLVKPTSGDRGGKGINRNLPHLGGGCRGINRQRPHLNDGGKGVNGSVKKGLGDYINALSIRLARVRVTCGDWARITGPAVTTGNGLTGVFLDPPYSGDIGRDNDLYRAEDLTVGQECFKWCVENQDNPWIRIALCGYEGEYGLPGWECLAWKAGGGYGSQNGNKNKYRERIWFSPHCLRPQQQQFELGALI